MNRALMFLAAGLFTIAACDNNKPSETKTEDPASKNATTTGATATAVTTAVTPPTIADSDLSTPADFEETAEKAISKATYKTELTTLEAEIAKE